MLQNLAHALGDQLGRNRHPNLDDRLSDQLFPGSSEHPEVRMVDVDDPAVCVGEDERVHCCPEHQVALVGVGTFGFLGPFAVGDVYGDGDAVCGFLTWPPEGAPWVLRPTSGLGRAGEVQRVQVDLTAGG